MEISQNFVAFSEYINFTYLVKNRQKRANVIKVWLKAIFLNFSGLETDVCMHSPEDMCMCKNHWRGCWETQNGFLSPLHTMCEHNLL